MLIAATVIAWWVLVAGAIVAMVIVVALVRVGLRSPRALGAILAALVVGLGVFGLAMSRQMVMKEALMREAAAQQQAYDQMAESLIRVSVQQQKDLEERTRSYLLEREKSVGDVFPLTEQTPSEVRRPGLAWMPEVDEQFDADIFPSKQLAVRALMRRVVPLFEDVLADETPAKVIQVTSGSRVDAGDLQSMFDTATEHLRKECPDAQVLFDPSDHRAVVPDAPRVEGGVSLQLKLTEGTLVSDSGIDDAVQLLQTLHASVKGVRGESVGTSVLVLDKPWVDQFDQFWSRRSGQFALARSDSFADSAEAAHQQALAKATDLLTPAVKSALNQREQRRGLVLSGEADVRDNLKIQLEDGMLATDRFSQRLRAPYGELWREAILLRIDSSALTVVINQMDSHFVATQRSQLSQAFAFCVLLLVIVVLYLLLNWITKGYYRSTVGLVLGLLGAAGSAAILLVVAL